LNSLLIRRHQSRNTLLLLALIAAVAVGLVFWNLDFIKSLYLRKQLTAAGMIIDGGITLIFLIGLFRTIVSLFFYLKEETALNRFVLNLDDEKTEDLLTGVYRRSLISLRYLTMVKLHESKTPINQSALASTLVAAESIRASLVRYINNILILTGVLGTIVSLSIALLGASDMMENTVNVSGMAMVIHGMSTAMSTTFTAILCYLFLGYFYMKLNDVQTNLISGIEQVTATHLIPRFQVHTESVLHEFNGLLRSLQGLVRQMEIAQEGIANLDKRLLQAQDDQTSQVLRLDESIGSIKKILRDGFRLSDKP